VLNSRLDFDGNELLSVILCDREADLTLKAGGNRIKDVIRRSWRRRSIIHVTYTLSSLEEFESWGRRKEVFPGRAGIACYRS